MKVTFFLLSPLLFATNGNKLSSKIENKLLKQNFTITRQNLSSTGQDSFPYNIIVDFPATEIYEKVSDSERNIIVFDFSQEDFESNEEFFSNFLQFLNTAKLKTDIQVLFSALDEKIFPSSKELSGTDVFASSIDDNSNIFAVLVKFTKSKKSKIETGTQKSATPLWLTRFTAESFFATETSFKYENKLLSLYSSGLIEGNIKLSYFIEREVPAVSISLQDEKAFDTLKHFILNFEPTLCSEWDSHYFFFPFPPPFKSIWISESSIIIISLIIGIIALLVLCTFSFTGRFGTKNKNKILHYFYSIPLIIAISYMSLVIGQKFCNVVPIIKTSNALFQFGAKIFVSIMLISLFFAIQEIFRLPVTKYIYSYMISVVSLLNIFIFSSINLMFFFLFSFEHVIVYFSRAAKRKGFVIFWLFIMIFPFIPYVDVLVQNLDDNELLAWTHLDFTGNILFSLVLFPFQMHWLKILFQLNTGNGKKNFTLKRLLVNSIFVTTGAFFIIFTTIFTVSKVFYEPKLASDAQQKIKLQNSENLDFYVRLSSTEFSGLNTNHIEIISLEEAVRYSVKIISENSRVPVYDSIYDYRISENEAMKSVVDFIIPDFPPEKIKIDYAATANIESIVEVTAIFETSDPKIFREEKIVKGFSSR